MTRCERRRLACTAMLRAWGLRGVLLAGVVMGVHAPAWAQLPTGSASSQRVGVSDVDRRITWVHWWEANRDTYLMQALKREGRAQRKVPADAEFLKQAVDALIESTKLDDSEEPGLTRVRVASTMSLGKIGTDAAVDRLIELTADPQQTVRTAAWLAIGASGHDRAKQELLEPSTTLKANDRSARAAALGLLNRGNTQAIDILKKELADAQVFDDQRVILQSLRLLHAPDLAKIGREVLRRTNSVNVASEAILGIGMDPKPDDAELMLALLRGGSPVNSFAYSNNGLTSETCFAAAQVLDGYAGFITDNRLRRVLTKYVFKTTPNGVGDYYRGAALLSLIPLAEREDEHVFEEALDGRTRVSDIDERTDARHELPREREFRRLDDPIRGYAAIAMGMYLVRFTDELPQQQAVPVGYPHEIERANRRFLNHLNRLLSNSHESPDLRAAAAMGLAFSGHPDAAEMIAKALQEADPDELMVIGYGTLAMALLGDERAAIPAGRYLKQLGKSRGAQRFNPDNATHDVLGLRAMALALGLVGGDQAASALSDAWATDPWLSLESAKALGWVEDDRLAESLIASLLENPKEPEAALAAMGLGELFESARPSRLARLSVGSNYTYSYANTPTPQVLVSDSNTSWSANGMCGAALLNAVADPTFQAVSNVYLYEVLLGP